jgi:hypothetical protein
MSGKSEIVSVPQERIVGRVRVSSGDRRFERRTFQEVKTKITMRNPAKRRMAVASEI